MVKPTVPSPMTPAPDLKLPRYGVGYRVFVVSVAVWVTVGVVLGFLGRVSNLPILEQTARNLYFHVPMWFTLMLGWCVAAWHSARYLGTGRRIHDVRAEQAALV